MTDANILDQIRRNPLFEGIDSPELDGLLEQIPVSELPAGSVILAEGAKTDPDSAELYLLLSGTVNVARILPGEVEHTVTQMTAPDFFGETAAFASGTRSARISAAEPVTVGVIDRNLLDKILAVDPVTVVKTISRVLARRLREANDTIVSRHLQQEKLATIGSITSQIAHDLKSPLNAVVGVADLIEDHTVQMPPQRQAEILRRAVQSVSGLVEDILAFASDKPRRPYQLIVVQELLKNVDDFGLSPIERKGRIHVIREIDKVSPIVGDSVALERMLLNLIKNASEAMTQGGTLTLGVHQDDGYVVLAVEDTGGGIPDEVRGRLFQSFVTSGKPGGTGLGLAMVKRTVDSHGGSIRVDSMIGAGTKFTIRIPCAPS